MFQPFRIVMSLVRRDYAVQYAGTSLGIAWVIIQYLFQIALFWLIFGVLFKAVMPVKAGMVATESDYLGYLLGGMGLWLPLSEMMLRSCGILVENRSLIRRTAIGMRGFLYLPLAQSILHYLIIMSVIVAIGVVRGRLAATFPLAILLGIFVLVFFSGWAFVLARIGVILKDVSPLMRLFLQIVFWSTPLVYPAFSNWNHIFSLNPLHGMAMSHRFLLYNSHFVFTDAINVWVLAGFVGLSLIVFIVSAMRMGPLVADHL